MKQIFTEEQKVHAQSIINKLILESRFFINTETESDDFKYMFDEEIFKRGGTIYKTAYMVGI